MALTARAQKLRDRMVTTPAICVERLRYMTESYRQTEGETDPGCGGPKALAYILEPYDRPHRRRRAFCGKLYQ